MLIRQVDRFLCRTGMAATRFGRLVARDPRLVGDMRNGREPRPALADRIEHFMNTYNEAHHAA